jgi:alpha-tubulin suppressor-like RCC1 family protein
MFSGTNVAGATTSRLSISSAQFATGGVYTVTCSNVYGTVTSQVATLNVVASTITTAPMSQKVPAGSNVTFSVVAAGKEPFGFQWYGNGTKLDGATDASLLLTNVQLEQSGTYLVEVSNYYGKVFSPSASLRVQPVVITTTYVGPAVYRGGTATFSPATKASVPLTYEWRFNGESINGQTGSSLTLTNVQFNQAGVYSATLSNTYGSTNLVATLTVLPVVLWGDNSYGQKNMRSWMTNVVGVAAGGYYNVALRSGGTVGASGGWTATGYIQTVVPPELNNVLDVTAGFYHSLALRADGTVVGWGDNTYGQCTIPQGLSNVVAVSAGNYNSWALGADGRLVGWGQNLYGETNVPSGLSNVVAVAGGGSSALALRDDGTVVAWGDNSYGQTNVPSGLSNVVAIASGRYHEVALQADGTVVVWGDNTYGQTNVPAGLSNVIAIASGHWHVLAETANGGVVGWGNNAHGETNTPANLTNVVDLSAGLYHSAAVVSDQPMPRQVQVLKASRNGDSFSLSVPSQGGRVYRLEYSTSLTDPNWTGLPLVAGTGGLLTLSDSSAPNAPRFYRVRRW